MYFYLRTWSTVCVSFRLASVLASPLHTLQHTSMRLFKPLCLRLSPFVPPQQWLRPLCWTHRARDSAAFLLVSSGPPYVRGVGQEAQCSGSVSAERSFRLLGGLMLWPTLAVNNKSQEDKSCSRVHCENIETVIHSIGDTKIIYTLRLRFILIFFCYWMFCWYRC